MSHLLLGKSLSDSPGLLLSQIDRNKSLALILLLQLSLGSLVVDSKNASDGLAYNTNLGKLGSSTSGDLRHTKLMEKLLHEVSVFLAPFYLRQFKLELVELFE